MLVWWGQPCRDLIEAGDVGLLLASLAVLAQTGLLLRYHRAPGPLSAAGVALAAFLGWFADPLLMLLSAPLLLLYYFTVRPAPQIYCGTSAWPAPSRRACWPICSGCWTGSITGGFARR